MPFKPKSLIHSVVCRHCKGEGCNYCQQQGVYGEMEGQTLLFDAPLYLAVKERRRAKQVFYIKQVILYLTLAVIIFIIWKLLVFIN